MRDYKHVKVPKSYRAENRRTATKRVNVGRGHAKRGGPGKGVPGMVLAALLAAALCIYGTWEGYRWLTHAEVFQIAGVDVRGVRSLSEAEVRDLAGMFTGQNVFRVDLEAATRRVLADPRVREVDEMEGHFGHVHRRRDLVRLEVLVEHFPRGFVRDPLFGPETGLW